MGLFLDLRAIARVARRSRAGEARIQRVDELYKSFDLRIRDSNSSSETNRWVKLDKNF